MEYRKKNLKPKPDTEKKLLKTLSTDKFMDKMDFLCQLRKQIFIYQNERGMQSAKQCTVTDQAMTAYLSDQLQKFIRLHYSKPTFSTTANAYFKRDPPNFLAQLDLVKNQKEIIAYRVESQLRQRRPQMEEAKIAQLCQSMNVCEITDVFNGRIKTLLQSVARDRNNFSEEVKAPKRLPSDVPSNSETAWKEMQFENSSIYSGQKRVKNVSSDPNLFAKEINESNGNKNNSNSPYNQEVRKRADTMFTKASSNDDDGRNEFKFKMVCQKSGAQEQTKSGVRKNTEFQPETKTKKMLQTKSSQNLVLEQIDSIESPHKSNIRRPEILIEKSESKSDLHFEPSEVTKDNPTQIQSSSQSPSVLEPSQFSDFNLNQSPQGQYGKMIKGINFDVSGQSHDMEEMAIPSLMRNVSQPQDTHQMKQLLNSVSLNVQV